MIRFFLLSLCFSAISIFSWGQTYPDVKIGQYYHLNLQRKNDHADAFILHNAKYYNEHTLAWETSHPSFGARGIVFRYGEGIKFFASSNPTTANNTFLPVTRFFIGNNGNIGAGTSSPEAKFTISQTGNEWNDGLRINRDASNYLTLTEDVTDIRLKNWGSGGIVFFTSAAEVFRINNNGDVGIGTSNPTQKFEVNGNILGSAENSAIGIDAQSNARLGFVKKSGTVPQIVADNATPMIFSQINQSGIYTNISGATLTERMRIEVNGNVGIGVSGPQGKLHLRDGAYWSSYNYGAALVIDGPHHNAIAMLDADNANPIGLANVSGTFAIAKMPSLGNTTTAPERLFTVQPSGNIGIGTENPDAKLAVKGKIHAQEVKVDMLGALTPDYVFEKTYNLQSLEEVEDYIKANKHLPEVPSAKEMEENGLNLKEMNLLLLKKVEELTLHMIELKKENEAIKVELKKKKNK